MRIDRIWLDALVVGKRHRPVDETRVAVLAESMATIGLQQPISVWFDDDDAMHLVAGLHRVRAAEKLGWEQIDAVTVEMDEIDREMWELAENLFRCDLTKEERDRHIKRYAELLKARTERTNETTDMVSRQVDVKPKSGPQGGRPTGIAREIAEQTGLSQRTVQRVLSDKPAPPPRPIEPLSDDEAVDRQVRALMAAWAKAGPDARRQFLDYIDTPVMDGRYA